MCRGVSLPQSTCKENNKRLEDHFEADMVEVAAAIDSTVELSEAMTRRERRDGRNPQSATRRAQPAELVEILEKVNAWCRGKGYENMHTPKKTWSGATKYALHTAVTHFNADMLSMLLECGADTQAKNSKGQTPAELAAAIDKKGSQRDILALLSDVKGRQDRDSALAMEARSLIQDSVSGASLLRPNRRGCTSFIAPSSIQYQ